MLSEVVIPTRPRPLSNHERPEDESRLPTSTKTDRRNLPLSMPSEKRPSRLDLYLVAFPKGRPLKRPRSLFGDVACNAVYLLFGGGLPLLAVIWLLMNYP